MIWFIVIAAVVATVASGSVGYCSSSSSSFSSSFSLHLHFLLSYFLCAVASVSKFWTNDFCLKSIHLERTSIIRMAPRNDIISKIIIWSFQMFASFIHPLLSSTCCDFRMRVILTKILFVVRACCAICFLFSFDGVVVCGTPSCNVCLITMFSFKYIFLLFYALRQLRDKTRANPLKNSNNNSNENNSNDDIDEKERAKE